MTIPEDIKLFKGILVLPDLLDSSSANTEQDEYSWCFLVKCTNNLNRTNGVDSPNHSSLLTF